MNGNEVPRLELTVCIRQALRQNPVTALTGPRQGGKTTLARQLVANETHDYFDLEARHAQGLVAVNAVASLAASPPRGKNLVEELWNSPTSDGLERYYEGLLYMLALLHCSGEFRIG